MVFETKFFFKTKFLFFWSLKHGFFVETKTFVFLVFEANFFETKTFGLSVFEAKFLFETKAERKNMIALEN